MLTFLTPQGTTYTAAAPQSPQDIGIPDRPRTMSVNAVFDIPRWEWVEDLLTKIQNLQATYAPRLENLRQAESAARLAGNEVVQAEMVQEYQATLKERDEATQKLIEESEGDVTINGNANTQMP